ncbi:RNA-directed RNA polymerase [ssRNA phage SRR5467090_9]|uniref:RNA-directed RNA polymerase n=1 Tax=ssRNA phage SRR5467090_9 TaxID=2786458 RepID=A0A8S5L0A9_9VIRU|nr:RNA-directed RNA polymerase [ssRNA phage SRR5467090_9]DAD50876.1 TPA_asm: RNA-directed RNA polymerase [ssRNA phage SRR5467090_9]
MRRKPEKPSDLEFYLQTTLRVYRDCAAICCLSPSHISKDVKTLEDRTRKEGMSFLTKTLPALGKCLDKALSRDVPMPDEHSFELSAKEPRLPLFMGAFWRIIFPVGDNQADHIDGDPPIVTVNWRTATHEFYRKLELEACAVRAVRQVCFLHYKLEGSHSVESERQAIINFVDIEADLPEPGSKIRLSSECARALENARMLIHYVLNDKKNMLDLENILPKHGPGSVATGEKPWEKFSFKRFYEKLDSEYSYPDYFFFNYTHLVDNLEILESMETCSDACAKIVLVPKDSRGPRIISMEPLELQWIQQGQMRALVKHLENHRVTAGFVNFTSQDINRDLALLHSSEQGFLGTMDMKDASDRVSVWLLEQLIPSNHLKKLLASRSDYTQLPDGQRLRLKKFAPMGSATCFPIEALIFWALAVGTLKDILCVRDVFNVPSVYVFGDDIIAPLDAIDRIRSTYSQLFLLVNEDKCCTGRFFRESCGMDAFKRTSVTPTRHHKKFAMSSPAALLAYVAYTNAHRVKGHASTAEYISGRITHEFGQIPVSNTIGEIPLCWEMPELSNEEVMERNLSHFRKRYNNALQRMEIRIQTPFTPTIERGEPDWHEIQRKGALGLSDPFGFRALGFEPCSYNMSKHTMLRWAWVDISRLAGK